MMDSSLQSGQTKVFRFILYFFLINTFLSLLIGINYLPILPSFLKISDTLFDAFFLWGFFSISFVAQMAIFFGAGFLFINIIKLIIPNKKIIFLLSILTITLFIFLLLLDAITFDMYHMHYASVGIAVFKVNAFSEVLSLSWQEIISLFAIVILLIIFESFIAWLTWQLVKKEYINSIFNFSLVFLIFCVGSSYSLNYIARELPGKYGLNTQTSYLMVKATRFIPYYDELYRLMIGSNFDRHVKMKEGDIDVASGKTNLPLKYPKHQLLCQTNKSTPLNIIFIVIDTWRYDAMNEKVTPAIYQFSKKSLQFKNNWSGGNCTKSGLFSLFYGIPANYWDAMLTQKQGPELIHQLIKAHYEMGIFSSAQLNFPAFDKTIFREVNPLAIYTKGETTIERDQAITYEFKNFLIKHNPQKPFFSMLFYDAAHNYCEENTPSKHPFQPWEKTCNRFALNVNSDSLPYFNRYKNAVYFIDSEIKQVFAALKQQHLMQNTIVIITGDHGEEINDKHSGYWQHASAYTSYQLHTPLIIYWPGQNNKLYSYFTTHYDIVPTLMSDALHCKNPLADYTTGKILFNPSNRPLLIAGSYADYAIISSNQIVRIYPGGDFELNDPLGHPMEKLSLQITPMKQAFLDLNSYFADTSQIAPNSNR